MPTIFIVKNPGNGEVLGRFDDKSTAERLAQRTGGVLIAADRTAWLAYGRIIGAGAKADAAGEGCQCPDCPNFDDCTDKGSDSQAERARIIGHMEDLGVGGLLKKAVAEGLTPNAAAQLLSGNGEAEIFGPGGRLAAVSDEGAWLFEWRSAAVQAEFGGNLKAFLLYKRAEAAGAVSIIGGQCIKWVQ